MEDHVLGTTSTLERPDAAAEAIALQQRYLAAQSHLRHDPSRAVSLLSVVVPVLDQPELTTACAEALFRTAPCAVELILIDNGSNATTKAALEAIRAEHPATRIVTNPVNQGFAYATNQGLAIAKGDWILMLNNDVIVGKDALLRMIALGSLDARFGLIGPMTNRASGPQQIGPIRYTNFAGIDPFADAYAARFEGAFAHSVRLVGLCLLIHRNVLDRIGGLDPVFYPGNFEDDDFCLRAVRAGFRPMISGDAYVHHEGGATFRAVKFDYKRAMQDNWELFCAKHGHRGALGPYPAKVLAESRAFDPALDRIPCDATEIFHAGIQPLPLESARAQRTLLFADAETEKWCEALDQYLARFDAADDRTLVVRPEPGSERHAEAVVRAIQTRCAATGRPELILPDILLDVTPLSPAERGRLYRAVDHVLLAGAARDTVYVREAELSGVRAVRDVGAIA